MLRQQIVNRSRMVRVASGDEVTGRLIQQDRRMCVRQRQLFAVDQNRVAIRIDALTDFRRSTIHQYAPKTYQPIGSTARCCGTVSNVGIQPDAAV